MPEFKIEVPATTLRTYRVKAASLEEAVINFIAARDRGSYTETEAVIYYNRARAKEIE